MIISNNFVLVNVSSLDMPCLIRTTYDLSSGCIYILRHVVFNEYVFPFKSSFNTSQPTTCIPYPFISMPTPILSLPPLYSCHDDPAHTIQDHAPGSTSSPQ